jgi:hypothetical protein
MTKLINITYTNSQFKHHYGNVIVKFKCKYKGHIKYVRRLKDVQITCLYKNTSNFPICEKLEYLIDNYPNSEIYIEELNESSN